MIIEQQSNNRINVKIIGFGNLNLCQIIKIVIKLERKFLKKEGRNEKNEGSEEIFSQTREHEQEYKERSR